VPLAPLVLELLVLELLMLELLVLELLELVGLAVIEVDPQPLIPATTPAHASKHRIASAVPNFEARPRHI
jgi:hypothetical protein